MANFHLNQETDLDQLACFDQVTFFDQVTERRGSGSYKWDSIEQADALPMWVADMDFPTAPAILEALTRRVQHGIFGYAKVPDVYYQHLMGWFERRYDFAIERDWVLYTSGVVPAISAVIKALTLPGNGVIVQTPVYNCFFSSIRNMGCQVIENTLINREGYYEIDFDDLEKKAQNPNNTVLLLCNPHNPVGRVWTEAELRKIGEICFANGVKVISDEIHCDLVFPEHHHQPFAALGLDYLSNTVTCHAPSKSFNIAGLQIANIIVPNQALRLCVDKALNIHEVCDVNPFGIEALIAAYGESEAWLDALVSYLYGNYQFVAEFLQQEIPALKLTKQEATYLAWIDCRALGLPAEKLVTILAQQAKLILSPGTLFGEAGEGFLRLNMACPRSVLEEGLHRLKIGLMACGQAE